MEKHDGVWNKWNIDGVRWQPRSKPIKNKDDEIIGYVGAWEGLDDGPSETDNTRETYGKGDYK